MTPYYSDDLVTIYHGDCREWVGEADAVVTDPPYGMGWDNKVTRAEPRRRGTKTSRYGQTVRGDDAPFDPTPWLRYAEVILWGSNHFAQRLPVGTTLVFVKRYESGFGSFLSDAEIAWMKGGHGVYCYRDMSMHGESSQRLHPTQKPLGLMRWCIQKTKGGTVLDPYMGSGTTLVAAKSLGRTAVGIEIEERYCEIAAQRCSQEALGLSFLGTAAVQTAVQDPLPLGEDAA